MAVDMATLAIKVQSSEVEQATKRLTELQKAGGGAESQMGKLGGESSSTARSMMGLVAAATAAVGGFYAIDKAIRFAIAASDEFKIGVISVAATLTDISRNTANIGATYAQNLAYSLEVYEELELEAAKHFASGKHLQEAFNILTQKGVVLRKEDVAALGTVVDKIMLMTQGQMASIQIAQELRSLIDGQARQTSQLAMLIRDQLGAGWEEIIEKERQSGNLIKFLAGLFPGLSFAVKDIENSWRAQTTTLETNLSIIARHVGIYEDIVYLLKDINSYLRDHSGEIGGGIRQGWIEIKAIIREVLQFIKDIAAIADKAIVIPIKMVVEWVGEMGGPLERFGRGGAQFRQDMGRRLFGDAYQEMPNLIEESNERFIRKPLADAVAKGQEAVELFGSQYEKIGYRYDEYTRRFMDRFKGDKGLPEVTGFAAPWSKKFMDSLKAQIPEIPMLDLPPYVREMAKPEKGKAGAEVEDRLRSIMDTLDKELARLTEGSFAEVDAWLKKVINDLEKLAAKGADVADAEVLARQVATAKKEKLESDFWDRIAKESGDAFAAINRDYDKDMRDFGGNLRMKEAILDVYWKRVNEMNEKQKLDAVSLMRTSLETAASTAPFLTQQLYLKQQALAVDTQMGRMALDRKVYEMEQVDRARERMGLEPLLTEEFRKQLYLLQGMAEKGKEFALQREKWMAGGIRGGASIFAVERVDMEATRAARSFLDTMRTAEQSLGEGMANAFIGFLRGKQTDFGEIFFSYAEVFFRKAFTDLSGVMFDKLGGVMRGWLGLKEPMAKPDGTYWNPIWVEVRGGGGLGSFGGLGGFFGGLGGSPEYAGILTGQIEEDWGMAGMADWFGALEAEANGFYGAQVAGYASLTGQSGSWLGQLLGSVEYWFNSLINGFGRGGMGGGGLLGGLVGSVIGAVGGAFLGGGNPAWFTAGNIGGPFGGSWFHEGGILMAHGGLRIPGWASDERLVLMQTGEGILPRHAMERIGRPLFEKLRQGDMPQEGETAPPGRPWNSIVVNAPITIKTPDPVAYKASRTQTQAQMAQDLTVAMRKLS